VLLTVETNAGLYLGAAVGGDRSPSMHLVSGDDDRASRCDEYINSRYAELPACTAPDRSVGAADAWSSRFASRWGALAWVAVGYRFGKRFRVELEADYGSVGLDTSSPIIAPSGVPYDSVAAPELADAYERIGNAEVLGLFVAAYVDFPNRTRFTPFVGIGAGIGLASMDYEVLWERTDNLDDVIYAGAGLANEDEIRRNLVGGDTRARQRLRDRLSAAIQELLGDVPADPDRIAREIAHLAERWDINEEIVRLRSHMQLFEETLEGASGSPVGKRLGFIMQEMHREANTIGAKANDARMAESVLSLKGGVERIREQLENVQ